MLCLKHKTVLFHVSAEATFLSCHLLHYVCVVRMVKVLDTVFV